LRAIHEPYTGTDGIARNWTSARLDSLGKWTFTTGTIAIRMKVAPASGIWPAFWLEGANLPQVGWPQAGEIDVVELFGIQSYVFQTLHGPQGTTAAYQVSANTPIPSGTSVGANYHVFSVTRTPGQIQFRIDGNLSGTLTRANLKSGQSWVYDTPMFVTLNLAVGGFAGAPTAATPSRAQLLVDWIRYYPS
jgi:beta-glucanase (GH16 family)